MGSIVNPNTGYDPNEVAENEKADDSPEVFYVLKTSSWALPYIGPYGCVNDRRYALKYVSVVDAAMGLAEIRNGDTFIEPVKDSVRIVRVTRTEGYKESFRVSHDSLADINGTFVVMRNSDVHPSPYVAKVGDSRYGWGAQYFTRDIEHAKTFTYMEALELVAFNGTGDKLFIEELVEYPGVIAEEEVR